MNDQLAINTLRILSVEAIQKANSGHPGLPLGAAPAVYTLWRYGMKHNPKNPEWINRDRFILSAGHGSALLYSLFHIFGYGVTMGDLQKFRQLDSYTPGHPEYGWTKGVDATTGPLGQGMAMAVGMAMAEKHLAARFNRPGFPVMDHYTYTVVGDGCLMEGITNEAASLAGTLGLDKLIVLYDSNNITIEGDTSLAFRENVRGRFEALGWDVHFVEDGNNIEDIFKAIQAAKSNKDKPSFIEIKTKIGYGSPKVGNASVHGSPLGDENLSKTKKFFHWNEKPFTVPEEVSEGMKKFIDKMVGEEEAWNQLMEEYKERHPYLAEEFEKAFSGKISSDLFDDKFYEFNKKVATRAASGEILNRLAKEIPELFGGSADLAPSNNSAMEGKGSFSKDTPLGQNIHFGVRELAMAAIANGIALHGGSIPYAATFFVFSDYAKPAMRLSALMGLRVLYILTHDSIGVGEDGPTHQPIEQLAMLRSMPNMTVYRPCDARETAAAWSYGLLRENGPTAFILSRQGLPLLEGSGKQAVKGAYVLKDFGQKIDIILMATGSEVHLAMEAGEMLAQRGYSARVISMPSMEVFRRQDEEYQESVLPKAHRVRLAIEAASTYGWREFVGLDGDIIGMQGFGASGPGDELMEKFGFTPEHIVEKSLKLLKDKL